MSNLSEIINNKPVKINTKKLELLSLNDISNLNIYKIQNEYQNEYIYLSNQCIQNLLNEKDNIIIEYAKLPSYEINNPHDFLNRNSSNTQLVKIIDISHIIKSIHNDGRFKIQGVSHIDYINKFNQKFNNLFQIKPYNNMQKSYIQQHENELKNRINQNIEIIKKINKNIKK